VVCTVLFCVGDGLHFPILAPAEHEADYVNYKGIIQLVRFEFRV
jgi:hypothetical protein